MSTTIDAIVVKNPPLSIRLDPKVRAALDAAADRDGRSLSNLAARIIEDWLVQNRYLTVETNEKIKAA